MKLIHKLLGKSQIQQLARLPLDESRKGKGAFLVAGALTDRGRSDDHNEDSLFVLNASISQDQSMLPLGLFIVADGMGGHETGEEASALAVRAIANWVLDKIYLPFLSEDTPSTSQQPIVDVLTDAALAAHSRIHQVFSDAGTTLTCAFVLGTNAFIAHVGDSRAYLFSKSSLRQITTDHSFASRLIELGQITEEQAKSHPQRHALYRALGRAGNLQVDTHMQSLPIGSSLLICSDGLWQMIPKTEMAEIIDGAPTPQIACRRLVAQANENGGEDNITAVLIQVRD